MKTHFGAPRSRPLEVSPQKIVVATRNPGKLRELEALVSGQSFELVSLDAFPDAPIVEEDQPTLRGNARKKAIALHRHTGLTAIADDTGLEVDALDGEPGVRSARFAGPEADDARNRSLLLERLHGAADRSARFRTVIACAVAGEVVFFEGVCDGSIADEERGKGGFGYDPIFLPAGWSKTFAEMTENEKNRISHRGRASRQLAFYLRTMHREVSRDS